MQFIKKAIAGFPSKSAAAWGCGIFARVSLIFIAVGCPRVVADFFYSEKIGSIHSGSHNITAH